MPARNTPAEPAVSTAIITDGGCFTLMKPAEVAKLFDVSERTLERWRQTGEGPRYVTLARRAVRYRPSEIEAFIAAGQRDNTAQH